MVVINKPKEFVAYWSPEAGELMAGSDYGCVDGWDVLTLVEKSYYDELKLAYDLANIYRLNRDMNKYKAALEEILAQKKGYPPEGLIEDIHDIAREALNED